MSWRQKENATPNSTTPQSQSVQRTSSQSSQQPSQPTNRWQPNVQQPQRRTLNHLNSPDNIQTQEEIDQRTKEIQKDSLETTKRALSRLQATETVAQNSAIKLATQTEKLSGIESKLDSAESKIKVSDAKADHLKSLQKAFFLPSFGSKKVNQREDELKREEARRIAEDNERKKLQNQRLGNLRMMADSTKNRAMPRHSNYSTPSGIERDDTEIEIDGNLDQISSGLSRLKLMSQGMNTELLHQDGQLSRLKEKTAIVDERVKNAHRKVDNINRN